MSHTQKPDFVFRWKRTIPFKSAGGGLYIRLLAADVCASALVMLDTACSEVVWRVLAIHSILQFPLHFPSLRHRVPSHFNWSLLNTLTSPLMSLNAKLILVSNRDVRQQDGWQKAANIKMHRWRIRDNLGVTCYNFFFTSSMLNMFRTLIHTSSEACDFSIVSQHWSCVLVSMCVGVSVWLGWGGIRLAAWK